MSWWNKCFLYNHTFNCVLYSCIVYLKDSLFIISIFLGGRYESPLVCYSLHWNRWSPHNNIQYRWNIRSSPIHKIIRVIVYILLSYLLSLRCSMISLCARESVKFSLCKNGYRIIDVGPRQTHVRYTQRIGLSETVCLRFEMPQLITRNSVSDSVISFNKNTELVAPNEEWFVKVISSSPIIHIIFLHSILFDSPSILFNVFFFLLLLFLLSVRSQKVCFFNAKKDFNLKRFENYHRIQFKVPNYSRSYGKGNKKLNKDRIIFCP